MNGSYYKSPIFINDLERDTYAPQNTENYSPNYNTEQNITYCKKLLEESKIREIEVKKYISKKVKPII